MTAEVTLKDVSIQQIGLLKLINRSPDIGDGWRQTSQKLWESLVLKLFHIDLMELDHENTRVRLTSDGNTLLRYIK